MTLSTHVLDISRGKPAAAITVVLYAIDGENRRELARAQTNTDGRITSPFGGDLEPGDYELEFHAGSYFTAGGEHAFYDRVPVRFRIDAAAAHYHVPLLLSPWGYSTYRGS
jgi:5-hydroxyisourate hydrolase